MFSYKDKTFCASDCTQEDCYRFFSEEEKKRASELEMPVALCDFSNTCPAYKNKTHKE